MYKLQAPHVTFICVSFIRAKVSFGEVQDLFELLFFQGFPTGLYICIYKTAIFAIIILLWHFNKIFKAGDLVGLCAMQNILKDFHSLRE